MREIGLGIGLLIHPTQFWFAYLVYALIMCEQLSIILFEKTRTKNKGPYPLGKYGEISFHIYRGRRKTLENGVVINPGDLYGEINLLKNMKLLRNDPVITATRKLYRDFLLAMQELASDLTSEEGRFPKEVVALQGASHLASERAMEKCGFEMDRSFGFFPKIYATYIGAMNRKENHDSFLASFRKKWGRTHAAWITIEKVIQLYQKG